MLILWGTECQEANKYKNT